MTDISQEAHEALVKVAVADATKATEAALETKVAETTEAKTKAEAAEKAAADLKTDNERLNKDLDEAQIKLKAAEDKVVELEKAQKEAEDAVKTAEVATARADQVKGLGIFEEDYVTEQASRWAGLDEAAWTSQVAEWQKLKGTPTTEKPEGDTAMAGASKDGLTTETKQETAAAGDGDAKTKPRRAALGLR